MIYHDLLTMVEHSHVNMKDKRRLGFLAKKRLGDQLIKGSSFGKLLSFITTNHNYPSKKAIFKKEVQVYFKL